MSKQIADICGNQPGKNKFISDDNKKNDRIASKKVTEKPV